MSEEIALLEPGERFTSFYFYHTFLKRVAAFYRQSNYEGRLIEFSLVLDEGSETIGQKYLIEPVTLPLIVSLFEQLYTYHEKTLNLILSNNHATRRVLSFLNQADFFHVVGDNYNPTFPIGKKLLRFDQRYLGDLGSHIQKPDHKIRDYSLTNELLSKIQDLVPERQRDYLIEFFNYKVRENFADLLRLSNVPFEMESEFVNILSELITNGVLHSQSNTYALMFCNSHKTSFSISDNGIGLSKSLMGKKSYPDYYKHFELTSRLSHSTISIESEQLRSSLLAIFETLYYSLLKDRRGLFDLMVNVVTDCRGSFRLHNETAQIIISEKMRGELNELQIIREEIMNLHVLYSFSQINTSEYSEKMTVVAREAFSLFEGIAIKLFDRYRHDTRYSAIRLFDVKFRGVHIEVEIPNYPNL